MDAVLSLIRSVSTIIFFSFKDITEDEIERNIEYLKQEQWFQQYLNDEKYKTLIIENVNVRKAIGRINTKKLSNIKYSEKQRRLIERELQKQFNYIHL